MRYENGFSGLETDNESLMATAVIVIREHFRDGPFCLHLNVAGLIRERGGQYAIALDVRGLSNCREWQAIVLAIREEGSNCRNDGWEQEFSHT